MNFSFTTLFLATVLVTKNWVLFSGSAFMKVYVVVGKLPALLVYLKFNDPTLCFSFISSLKNHCYWFQVFRELEPYKFKILHSRGLALKSRRITLAVKNRMAVLCQVLRQLSRPSPCFNRAPLLMFTILLWREWAEFLSLFICCSPHSPHQDFTGRDVLWRAQGKRSQ